MTGVPPPNQALADLAALLGEDNVRSLVRTFLREYPSLLRQFVEGDAVTRRRIAHSLKSNTRVIGLASLSGRMAELEARLANPETVIEMAECAEIAGEFEAAALPLRAFAGT